MRSINKLAVLAVSATLLVAPTVALASAPPVTSEVAPSNGWLALSMLTPSGSVGLGGTGVAAAAQPDMPPPPPESAGIGMPPIPVLAVLAAVIAVDIYIATKNHSHHRIPNSPA